MRRGTIAGAAALLLRALASLFTGVMDIGPAALVRDPAALRVMAISRLPRTLAVMLTGASMAVAGLIMQMLARNRFIEPTTAGTGQSAALGILAVSLPWPAAPIWAQMTTASLTALNGSAGFLLLVRRLPPTQPLLVPLVGLIYGAIIGAAVTFSGYQLDMLQYVEIWMNGELSGVLLGRYELLWLSGALALVAWFVADRFTIAGLGREASVSLGLNYGQVVIAGLLIVSIVTALTVVTVGMIPFVGLVVPNIVSRLMGDNLRATLPFVAAFGAGLVLLCDILGRVARHPYEIPVGTVFCLLVAALAHLVVRSHRHALLMPAAALIAGIVLVGGQTLVARAEPHHHPQRRRRVRRRPRLPPPRPQPARAMIEVENVGHHAGATRILTDRPQGRHHRPHRPQRRRQVDAPVAHGPPPASGNRAHPLRRLRRRPHPHRHAGQEARHPPSGHLRRHPTDRPRPDRLRPLPAQQGPPRPDGPRGRGRGDRHLRPRPPSPTATSTSSLAASASAPSSP